MTDEEEILYFDPYLRTKPKKHGREGKIVEAPSFGAPVADTHAHLPMLPDAGLALARAAVHGISFIECFADLLDGYIDAIDKLPVWEARANDLLADWQNDGKVAVDIKLPQVRFAIGVHPHNAKDYTSETEAQLKHAFGNPLTSAVGEIGLDYHYDISPRPAQRELFAREVELAHEFDLPIVLHVREAFDDAFAIMQNAGWSDKGVLLHCYTSDAAEIARWVDAGCYVAFGGAFTFKKLEEVREAAAYVPRERLLTETDAPFMAPEPFRGTTCEPAHTIHTAQAMYEFLHGEGAAEGMSALSTEVKPNAVTALSADGRPAPSAKNWAAGLSRDEFLNQLYDNAQRLLNQPRD
jgi:TatD DNase family protein